MKYSTFLGVALAMGVTPASLWAGETANTPHEDLSQHNATTQQTETAETYRANRPVTESSDKVTPTGLMRASELMNKGVYNEQEEQIGSINDVVLDTKSGEVKYVALSTGGFLGLGDKLFAVPWKAVKCETQDGEHRCVMDVSEKKLENAEGFDQDNWPNMADRKWQMKNDRHYQTTQTQQSAR